MMSKPDSTSALLLIGHGSSHSPDSARAIKSHADAIRERGLFDQVHVAFWKQEPYMGEVLESIQSRHIDVVPVLASDGYITKEVIPEALGLTGEVNALWTPNDVRVVRLHAPVGTHETLPAMCAEHAGLLALECGIEPGTADLLLVAHGNPRNPKSAERTYEVARAITETGAFAHVHPLFIDEDPKVVEWCGKVAKGRTALVLPFMIAPGVHAAVDIPTALGLNPKLSDLRTVQTEGGVAGPFESSGRILWCTRAIGAEPFIVDIILERIAEDEDEDED